MFKTVVFDYGGVVTTQKRSKLLSAWAAATYGVDQQAVYQIFNRKDLAHAYSKGAISQAEFYQHAIDLGIPLTVAELASQFASYNAPDPDMEKLLRALAQQIDLCLISDSMPELTADVRQRFGQVFRVAVFSDEEKCLKDEGKLFEIGFAKIQTPPLQCIYIDDREEKLVYPKSIGVTVIHFTSHQQLVDQLRALLPQLKI